MMCYHIPIKSIFSQKVLQYSIALVLSVYCFFFAGCLLNPSDSDTSVSGTILQPGSQTYDEDKSIVFEAKVNSVSGINSDNVNIHWKSSLEGDLGEGTWLSRKLIPGEHTITLLYKDHTLTQKTINIQPIMYERGNYRLLGLGSAINQILLPAGKYSPFLYSLDGKTPAVTIQDYQSANTILPAVSFNRLGTLNEDILGLKKFTLVSVPVQSTDRIKKEFTGRNNIQGIPDYSALSPLMEIGQTRAFVVADTTGAQTDGISVTGRLVYSSDRLSIWIDENALVSESVLAQFLDGLKFRAWPRVLSIWGNDWADPDNDNALAVLITPLINQQEKAIGFFNPADLYPRDINVNSPAFNPVSNEMDIIYLAAPVEDSSVFAYSIGSILATFCHEATHLIGFSRTYYLPTVSGQEVTREELFLDEGLAHLTESLCGYGVSGGNLAFFASYLENPEQYSLCKADADGASDSIGKRGMAAAFLSWLFWKKGGAVWDGVDPGKITDTGGLSFLRHLLATSQRGLVNISAAADSDSQALLVRWFTEIDLQDTHVLNPLGAYFDPIGGEVITMSPFYGNMLIGSKIYTLNGPFRKDFSQQNICVPYSAIWGKTINLPNKKTITVDSTIVDTNSYVYFNMIE